MAGVRERQQFCKGLRRDTAQMMQNIHRENQAQAHANRKELMEQAEKGLKERQQFCKDLRRDTTQMMQKIHRENQAQDGETHRMMRGFAVEPKEARANIRAAYAALDALRMGKPMPAAHQPKGRRGRKKQQEKVNE